MKRTILWIGAGLVIAAAGGAGWQWWTHRSDGGGYRYVAEAMCARFASDAVANRDQWSPGKRGAAADPKAEYHVFSRSVDARLLEARALRDGAMSKAGNDGERFKIDRLHSTAVLGILSTASPEYLALCHRLTAVYLKCDGLSKEPEKFKSCVEVDQQPVVMGIAARLFRAPEAPPR